MIRAYENPLGFPYLGHTEKPDKKWQKDNVKSLREKVELLFLEVKW